MTDDRRRILEMLAQGKLTISEADQLLGAIGAGQGSAPREDETPARKQAPRFLRVKVESKNAEKPEHVDVRVPLQLIRAGVKLSAFIPESARPAMQHAVGAKGIDLDLSALTPAMLSELIDGLSDLRVDVDDEKESVRVFCE